MLVSQVNHYLEGTPFDIPSMPSVSCLQRGPVSLSVSSVRLLSTELAVFQISGVCYYCSFDTATNT